MKGKREGYGTYMFPDGEKYEGQWFQDQQHGRGIYYFMNNNRYDGMWFQDYQHGKGTMYYYNGDIYEGDWVNDKRGILRNVYLEERFQVCRLVEE